MAKLNQILLGLALLLCAAPLAAQPCYIQLGDATGVPLPPAQLAELEVAACELRAAFPVEFQGDFAVYDFGFYLHQEGFAGGVPEVFQTKVAEVEQESAYFLLFGRQLSRGGGVAEIWLKAKLPSTGAFSCQEADFYSMVEFKVRWAVSQAAAGGPGTPESIASAEVQGIQALRGWVEEIVACCDLNLRAGAGCSLCSWAYADVVDYHAQMGFATYETEVSPPSDGLDSLCLCSYDYQVNSAEHALSTGAVNMSVSFSTLDLPGIGTLSATDIFSFLSDLGEFYAAEGTAFYAALSDQTMFCSSSGDGPSALRGGSGASVGHDEIEAAFGACEVGVWYNVLYTDHIATLAVKVKGMDVEGAMWLLNLISADEDFVEAALFAVSIFSLRQSDPAINYDRCLELFVILENDPDALLNGCLNQNAGIDIEEYSDLLNFSIPQGSLSYLNGLGEGFNNQPIGNGTSALTNLDYFGVEITVLPDINGDGAEDSVAEIFEAIRTNFTVLASGEVENFEPLCPMGPTTRVWWEFEPYTIGVDDIKWMSSVPLNSLFFIDAGAGAILAKPFSDKGAVITSQFTDGCCWIFSTIQTPRSGSQPLAGNRQFGLRVNSNGNIEFYTRAVDRARLPLIMHMWSSQWNDCGDKDYYNIGVQTWSNLQIQVRDFLIAHGGQAIQNEPLYERVNFYELRQRLRSPTPVSFVSCD